MGYDKALYINQSTKAKVLAVELNKEAALPLRFLPIKSSQDKRLI